MYYLVYTFSNRIRCVFWKTKEFADFSYRFNSIRFDSVQFIYVNTYQKLILLDSHRKTSTNLFIFVKKKRKTFLFFLLLLLSCFSFFKTNFFSFVFQTEKNKNFMHKLHFNLKICFQMSLNNVDYIQYKKQNNNTVHFFSVCLCVRVCICMSINKIDKYNTIEWKTYIGIPKFTTKTQSNKKNWT